VRFYQAVCKVVNIFAPRVSRAAMFWGANSLPACVRASRVLAMASSPSRTFLTYSIKAAMKRRESAFRRDAETRSPRRPLPNHPHGGYARQITSRALAPDSGAASVSYAISEWALVWVSMSDCLKRWLWQSASESQMAWPSKLPWLSQLPSELRLASKLLWQSQFPSELQLASQLLWQSLFPSALRLASQLPWQSLFPSELQLASQ
jgi:hypothetical protein